jgi:hypothetical protein
MALNPPRWDTQTGGGCDAAPSSGNKPQARTHDAATALGGQNTRGKHPRQQGDDSGSCPVHPGARHGASECREILKLAERVSKRREHDSRDDSYPLQRAGKEKVSGAKAAPL